MLDLVSIGDVMIDHFFFVRDAHVHCELKDRRCRIDLPYGMKIPVAQYVHAIGGNCANVAVGAARLGLASALSSIVGDDSGGREVIHKMKKEGVQPRWIVLEKTVETNISAVLSVQGERTILVHHAPRDYRAIQLAPARAYYLTSAGPSKSVLAILHRRVLESLKGKDTALLAFNPGTYQLKLGLKPLAPILRRTNLLFLNKEEAQELLGRPNDDVPTLVKEWKRRSIPTVVVTDGLNGAWAADSKGMWHQGIFPMAEVERTGAGDAFSCAFVCATLLGKKLPEALRWAAAESASVVGQIGPQEGLLTQNGLQQLLTKFRSKRYHPVALM